MIEKKKSKKIILSVFAVIIILILIMSLALSIIDRLGYDIYGSEVVYSYEPLKNPDGKYFCEINYDENIFDDEKYISKNRDMSFFDGVLTVTYSEENLQGAADDVIFFYNYFQSIIKGDAEYFNNCYTPAYYENNGRQISKYEKFTMQKIYNIRVKKLSEAVIENASGNITKGLYEVSYEIMDNNGTFRPDLPISGSIPLVFEVLKQNERTYINSIVMYSE